jgi:osmotically-inducible protein OsmY
MANKSLIGKTTLALTLALLLVAGAWAAQGSQRSQPRGGRRATVDCTPVTDADIVKTIQDKITADRRFNGQWKQINVSAKDGVVTLNGWVKGKAAVTALGQHARAVQCVKKVNNKVAGRLTVGCPPGQKLCGDICIDADSSCNPIEGRQGRN